MATTSFTACMDFILEQEGGFSLDRSDPGNWTGGRVGRGQLKGTNMGIAACTFPDLDIKHLTRSQAEEIYRSHYWDLIDGDILPSGVDLVVFDFAVNSGLSLAAKSLKKTKSKKLREVEMIRTISAERLSFLHALQSWPRFGKGWGRRVAACEARALAMSTQSIEDTPLHEHMSDMNRRVGQEKALAGTTVIVSSSAAILGTSFISDAGIWIIMGVVPCLVAAGLFGFSAWRHSLRLTASLNEVQKFKLEGVTARAP